MTEHTDDLERYARQLILSEIGVEGQRRLLASTAVVIGCGALGTHIANGIVRAGVGRVRVVDRDFIELNNLQRQLLFDEEDIAQGLPKAIAAANKLRRINSQVQVEAVVTEAEGVARSAPDGAQTVVFALHEGTKVRIERREQDWLLIRLANGLGGWLPAAVVTEI